LYPTTDDVISIGQPGTNRWHGGYFGTLGLTHNDSTLLHTTVALADGSSSNSATLTNAPAAGNPSKWVKIDDDGTTRWIPTWT